MKLYWRYKKDGKWTWIPAEHMGTYTDEDGIVRATVKLLLYTGIAREEE